MSAIEQLLEAVLQKIKSGDQTLIKQAEEQTKAWEEENLPGYAFSLGVYMATTAKSAEDRTLCGILLRGIWWSKDPVVNAQKQQKWLAYVPLDAQVKIKETVLHLLADPISAVANQAAQIVARIALIELPQRGWQELIPILLQQMKNPNAPNNLKRATLETIGYICEEISPEVLSEFADQILTAVIHGMRADGPDEKVKLAACNALFLALSFCQANFQNPTECSIIMTAVLSAMTTPNEEIRISAYAILTEIATLHYDKLSPFMNEIFKVTLNAIKDNQEDEDIAKFSIEFWCTICDEELSLLDEIQYAKDNNLPDPPRCDCFIKGAVKFLTPLLCQCLTLQQKNADPDEWTISMAAGVCLSLVAQVVKDDVVQYVMPFVEQHITAQDWKFREAAVLAFGSILDGPTGLIQKLISQAIVVLLQHLKDPIVAVRDTTSWTLASILKSHHKSVLHAADEILKCLCESLGDPSPRVAAHSCFAIHNLALSFEDEMCNPLNKYFVEAVRMLLLCADRGDSDSEHLRVAAYESLNVVLATAPETANEALSQVTLEMLGRLDTTFGMGILSQDDQNRQNQLQGLLCGALQVLTQRMDEGIRPFADPIMVQVIRLFRSKKDSGVYEEGLLTVGAIANVVEGEFDKYMNDLAPHLLSALQKADEYAVCSVSVGLVGDISRALGPKMMPYCDRIITLLLQNLQSRDLERSVKPPILSSFGDLALAIGGGFEKYLEVVLLMLKQASETVMKTEISPEDYDLIDYINQLREGICEAYTGIIQGLRADKKVDKVFPSAEAILRFIHHIAQDPTRTEAVTRGAVGIIGDLVSSFRNLRQQVSTPSIQNLVQDCMDHQSAESKEIAAWVQQIIST